MKRLIILFLLLAILLSACGEAAAPASTPTQTKRVVNTLLPARPMTPNLTPLDTIKDSSSTSDTTPTFNDTAIANYATTVADWTATRSAGETAVAPFPENCAGDYGFLVSPDGQKMASFCRSGPNLFEVISREGQVVRRIRNEVPPFEDPSWGGAYCEAHPYHWSADSRYLYFFLNTCAVWDPIPDYYLSDFFVKPNDLYQMDAVTGDWGTFVAGGSYYSFSATGRRLVTFKRYGFPSYENPNTSYMSINSLDLKTGENLEYILDGYLAAAHLIWSIDGTQFIFIAEKNLPMDYQTRLPSTYTLYVVDTIVPSIRIVRNFPDSLHEIVPLEWNGRVIKMTTKIWDSNQNEHFEEFFIDLDSGEILSPPSTPTP